MKAKTASNLLRWGTIISVIGGLTVLLSGYGYQWGWWHFSFGFSLIPWGTVAAVVGGIIGIIGFFKVNDRARSESIAGILTIVILVAALGNSQLRKTEKLIKKKKFIFNTYKKYLNLKIIRLNENLKNVDPIYWMSTIQIKTKKNIKEKIIKHCLKKKIALRPFFYPISQFKLFKNQRRRNQISYDISKCSVNLPSGNDLNEKKIKYICKVINQYVENEL